MDCLREICPEHDSITDRIHSMEEKLIEVHNDVKDIKIALIGDLSNPGWITKLTNDDKEAKARLDSIEKKLQKYETIFEKLALKVIGALTTAALAGGGITAIIQYLVK